MLEIDQEQLKPFARRYIWWKSPDDAVKSPQRVAARVMDIGDYDDILNLAKLTGTTTFATSSPTPRSDSSPPLMALLALSIGPRHQTR